jgi:hypothetical protein
MRREGAATKVGIVLRQWRTPGDYPNNRKITPGHFLDSVRAVARFVSGVPQENGRLCVLGQESSCRVPWL